MSTLADIMKRSERELLTDWLEQQLSAVTLPFGCDNRRASGRCTWALAW
jgi:hypothetical protein